MNVPNDGSSRVATVPPPDRSPEAAPPCSPADKSRRLNRRRLLMGFSLAWVVVAALVAPKVWDQVMERSYVVLLAWPERHVQLHALEELSGRKSKTVVPHFIAMFHGRERLAIEASRFLSDMGAVAVPSLQTALSSEHRVIRYWAIRTLARMGSDVRHVFSSVAARLADGERLVRHEAITVLSRTDRRRSARPLLAVVRNDELDVMSRVLSVQVLGALGRDARPAFDQLERLSSDRDVDARLREHVGYALEQLHRSAPLRTAVASPKEASAVAAR